MPVLVNLQEVADRYASALQAPRLLFDLFPKPRPQGRPPKKYSPLPSAIVLGVAGAFESLAEDLLCSVLYAQGATWAHIAKNADLTNPSLATLLDALQHSAGTPIDPSMSVDLMVQSSATGWRPSTATDLSDIIRQSESWIQVRHCISHGLVRGMGAEIWPGPAGRAKKENLDRRPKASDVLAYTNKGKGSPERALYFWPSVNCARIFSAGSIAIIEAVALELDQQVDTQRVCPDFG